MSSNNHTNGTLQAFEKNRYFAAKLMTARDMLAEQDYHAERLETLARYVNGEGVVCGLAIDSIEADGTELTVGLLPGVALDADGNPIVVTGSDPMVAKRPESDADADIDPEDPVALYLRYDECSVERVPLPGSENACKQECTYNRILEVYEIVAEQPVHDDLSTVPGQKFVPSIAFPKPADVTEVVSETDGKTIPETDPGLRKIATEYHQGKDDSNRDPPDVFLGVWERGSNGWTQVEHGALVYTNDMLYAAIARHAADFHNPHHTTLELSAAADESEPDDEEATAFLKSSAIYSTDETLLFDGKQLVEDAVDTDFEETEDQQRRFHLRKSVGQGNWNHVTDLNLDETGKIRLETADLDGTYVLIYRLRRSDPPVLREVPVRVVEEGVGELAENVELASVAFTVSGDLPPESTDADLVIRDDARPEGTVRVHSSDDTLLVGGTPGENESPAALDLRASISTLQERLDMVETVNGVGPDDEGNLSLVSETETVQIDSETEDHTVNLEVTEYDPIESINEVEPSDDGKFFLKSNSVDISDPGDPQSPNTLQLEVEMGGIERINTVEPGANGEIQLRSETLTISPDTDANAIDFEVVDTSDELRDDLAELGERVDDLETSRIKHSVHCTGMSYRVLAERYSEEGSLLEPIEAIIDAVDTVMDTGDYSASAYLAFIEEIKSLQKEVNNELNDDIATQPSIDRYEMALERLTQLPRDAGAVGDLTVAQECLSKAAEWIQTARQR